MVRLTEDNSILPNERGMTDIYERKHAAKRKIPCEGAVSLSVLLLCIIIKTSNENIQYIYCYSHAFRLHGKKKSLSYCVWLASFCFLIMCSQFPRVMNKYGWNILIVGVGVFFKWSLWYSLAQTKGKKNWHYLTMPYSRKLCTIFFITH